MSSESALISLFASRAGAVRADVRLGIGDDAAIMLPPPPGHELVVCTDTLVEGVHFLPGTDPESLGHKALAVNLSDLAAMGAEPAWALLSLSSPAADAGWVGAFARGFDALACEHGVALVGGDTTRGPLSVTVQAAGHLPEGTAIRRSGAEPGDGLYLSGPVGDAALALSILRSGGDPDPVLRVRLDRPRPRVGTGIALLGVAHAAIDVSDGLLPDLRKLLDASGCGADLDVDAVPRSDAFRHAGGSDAMALAGGDDYELLCAIPDGHDTVLTRIGTVTAAPGLRTSRHVEADEYRHFG